MNTWKVTSCTLGVSEGLALVSMMRPETLVVLLSQDNREGRDKIYPKIVTQYRKSDGEGTSLKKLVF